MKYLILIVTFLVPLQSFSQDYSFKRAAIDGQIVKTVGIVNVNDTLISIKYSNQPIAKYPVQVILKKDEFTQYKVVTEKETSFYIFIQPNLINNKNEKYSMTINLIDKSNDYKSKIVYFLIPEN